MGFRLEPHFFCMAERQGFEPWVRRRTMVFKTTAFDHSATSPIKQIVLNP